MATKENPTPMTNDEIYRSINMRGGLKQNSIMGAIPHATDSSWMDINTVTQRLDEYAEFKLIGIKKTDENRDDDFLLGDFDYHALICFRETEHLVRITACSTQRIDNSPLTFNGSMEEEDKKTVLEAEYYLEISFLFSNYPIQSYHFQLKMLHALMPNAALIIDFSTQTAYSWKWLDWVASSKTQPPLDYLFRIESIPQDLPVNQEYYWLKTSGLKRCGTVELEIVNIEKHPQEMFHLLLAAAREFILNPQGENAVFHVGYNINLCWIRWEEAFMLSSPTILGGLENREKASSFFNTKDPSGILFAIDDGDLHSPEIYGEMLKEENILYPIPAEVQRIQDSAKETFPYFQQLFEQKKEDCKYSEVDENEPQWSFFIKLNLLADHPISELDTEELWIRVQEISKEEVKGFVVNETPRLSRFQMHQEVSVDKHNHLSDWIIYNTEEEYNPDTVYLLTDSLK